MSFAYFKDRETIDSNYEYETLGKPETFRANSYSSARHAAEYVLSHRYGAAVELESYTVKGPGLDQHYLTVQPVKIRKYRDRSPYQ